MSKSPTGRASIPGTKKKAKKFAEKLVEGEIVENQGAPNLNPDSSTVAIRNAIHGIKPQIQSTPDFDYPDWESIQQLYEQIGQGILDFMEGIKANAEVLKEYRADAEKECEDIIARLDPEDTASILYQRQRLEAIHAEHKKLTDMINTASNDSVLFSQELKKIQLRHASKTGRLTSPNELDEYYAITEDYRDLFESYKALIFPVTIEVTAALSEMVSSRNPSQNLETLVKDVIDQAETQAATPNKLPLL